MEPFGIEPNFYALQAHTVTRPVPKLRLMVVMGIEPILDEFQAHPCYRHNLTTVGVYIKWAVMVSNQLFWDFNPAH